MAHNEDSPQQQRSERSCFSAPAERNRDPILVVLRRHLPASGRVLEIASGSGQHVVHFAAALPKLEWQPTDPNAAARDSIAAWCEQAGLANVRPPIDLDVHRQPWPVSPVDAVLCINMIHIAPWSATAALFEGSRGIMNHGAVLYLYGPFRRHDRPTAPSNEQFDTSLRERDPAWGLRDLEAVIELGRGAGFELAETVDMPANNLSVIFRRSV